MACPTTVTPYGAALVVSSTTRPTTAPDLFAGRIIYEADTLRTLLYDGTGWVILDEPINTNTSAGYSGITTGTPTYANEYRRQGGHCWFKNLVTFGGAPGAIASLKVLLPIATIAIDVGQLNIGFRDAGVAVYMGINDAAAAAATTVDVYVVNSAGTYASFTAVSATVPFTFGAGDSIVVSGWFRSNTRYL